MFCLLIRSTNSIHIWLEIYHQLPSNRETIKLSLWGEWKLCKTKEYNGKLLSFVCVCGCVCVCVCVLGRHRTEVPWHNSECTWLKYSLWFNNTHTFLQKSCTILINQWCFPRAKIRRLYIKLIHMIIYWFGYYIYNTQVISFSL